MWMATTIRWGEQDYQVQWYDTGVYMTGFEWDGPGWERYYFYNDNNVLLAGADLALKKKVKSSSNGYGSHRLYGVSWGFNGKLESEFEIVGIEKLRLMALRMKVLRLNGLLISMGQGQLI